MYRTSKRSMMVKASLNVFGRTEIGWYSLRFQNVSFNRIKLGLDGVEPQQWLTSYVALLGLDLLPFNNTEHFLRTDCM